MLASILKKLKGKKLTTKYQFSIWWAQATSLIIKEIIALTIAEGVAPFQLLTKHNLCNLKFEN